jgi:hypothetical protein
MDAQITFNEQLRELCRQKAESGDHSTAPHPMSESDYVAFLSMCHYGVLQKVSEGELGDAVIGACADHFRVWEIMRYFKRRTARLNDNGSPANLCPLTEMGGHLLARDSSSSDAGPRYSLRLEDQLLISDLALNHRRFKSVFHGPCGLARLLGLNLIEVVRQNFELCQQLEARLAHPIDDELKAPLEGFTAAPFLHTDQLGYVEDPSEQMKLHRIIPVQFRSWEAAGFPMVNYQAA